MIFFAVVFSFALLWTSEAVGILDASQCYLAGRVNEVFSPCGNNPCQNTCRNPLASTGCIGSCIAGCICAQGYIRNTENHCVLPSACDVMPLVCTGANEVFTTTGNNNCQPTCSNLNIFGCIPTTSASGCICKPGFVKNALGSCVLSSSCPVTCPGHNEHFSLCGNNGCQQSCNRPDVSRCIPVCSIPSCVCNPGYMRDSNGVCILPHQCPSPICIKPNEISSPCGNDGCQRSCTRLDVSNCIPVCSVPGCICAIGFLRDPSGACTPTVQGCTVVK